MSTWSALGITEKTVQLVRLRMAESATAGDRESTMVQLSGDAGAMWVNGDGRGILGIIPAGRTDSLLNLGHPVRACGVSAPFELGDHMRFRAAMDQAERAHVSGTGVVHFERLVGRGFSSLVDAGAASTWAAEYVGAIAASSEATELLATVRAWLGHHGQVDAAATELGVHRHTVRHRLRRAETLLERSFDDPAVRADLWFALLSLDEQSVPVG
jgi:purine catabolism regulator